MLNSNKNALSQRRLSGFWQVALFQVDRKSVV